MGKIAHADHSAALGDDEMPKISRNTPKRIKKRIMRVLIANPNAYAHWKNGEVEKANAILAEDYLSTANLLVKHTKQRVHT